MHFGLCGGRMKMPTSVRSSATPRVRCRNACVVDHGVHLGRRTSTPRSRMAQSIIYETHVKGFTVRHPEVPATHARHLRWAWRSRPSSSICAQLGVTAIELMPVQAFVDDRHLVENESSRITGATTRSAFSRRNRAICRRGRASRVQDLRDRLHDAGIEVILDVVYNHTAEGNHWARPCASAASTMRRIIGWPRQPALLHRFTGCGNTLNLRHPRVLQLVIDSLRYWVEEMHVDGFRFDLATTLAREFAAFDSRLRFLRRCAAGSGAFAGEADCRALGYRRRRLSARQLPGRMGGMERPVPRQRTTLTGGAMRGDRHACGRA